MYHGWLNIDKPEGLTSADVVSVMRKVLSMKKVGHAGTLDPMATGVLPIAFGEATKTMKFMQDLQKEYYFTVKFGASTDSFDRLGNVVETTNVIPSLDEIKQVLKYFIGEIDQVPPKFSAIKVDGVRAYTKARQGEDVKLAARKVSIYELELLKFSEEACEGHFRVLCSKGTYVRSLGNDIAIKLHSLGHLTVLRRTKVGLFNEENIKSIEKVKEMVHNKKIRLLSINDTFRDMPFVDFSIGDEEKIRNGVSVKISIEDRLDLDQQEAFAKVGSKLIAIGIIDKNVFRPIRGFNFN